MAYRNSNDTYGPNDVFALLGTLGKLEAQGRQNRLDKDTSTSLDVQTKDPSAQRPDDIDAQAWENAQTMRAQREQAQTALAGNKKNLFDANAEQANAYASQSDEALKRGDISAATLLTSKAQDLFPDGFKVHYTTPVSNLDDAGKEQAKQRFGEAFDGTGIIYGTQNHITGQQQAGYVPDSQMKPFIEEMNRNIRYFGDARYRQDFRRQQEGAVAAQNLEALKKATPIFDTQDGTLVVKGLAHEVTNWADDGYHTKSVKEDIFERPIAADQFPTYAAQYYQGQAAKLEPVIAQGKVDLQRAQVGAAAAGAEESRAKVGLIREQTNATRALADQRDAKTEGLGSVDAKRVARIYEITNKLAENDDGTMNHQMAADIYSTWNALARTGTVGAADDPEVAMGLANNYRAAVKKGLPPIQALQAAKLAMSQKYPALTPEPLPPQPVEEQKPGFFGRLFGASSTAPRVGQPKVKADILAGEGPDGPAAAPTDQALSMPPQQLQASGTALRGSLFAQDDSSARIAAGAAQLGQISPIRQAAEGVVDQTGGLLAGGAQTGNPVSPAIMAAALGRAGVSKLRDFASSRYPGVKMSTPEGAALYIQKHPEEARKFLEANPDMAERVNTMLTNLWDR